MIASDVPESFVWSAIGWDGGNYLMSSELHFERMIRHAEKLGLECPPDLSDRVFSNLAPRPRCIEGEAERVSDTF